MEMCPIWPSTSRKTTQGTFMTLLAHKSFSQAELKDICYPSTHQLSMTHWWHCSAWTVGHLTLHDTDDIVLCTDRDIWSAGAVGHLQPTDIPTSHGALRCAGGPHEHAQPPHHCGETVHAWSPAPGRPQGRRWEGEVSQEMGDKVHVTLTTWTLKQIDWKPSTSWARILWLGLKTVNC